MLQQKHKSVRVHDFAMNPRTDVPRSQFDLSHKKMIPFSFSYLIPILAEPVLPGDTWNCRIGVSARTAVPIAPIMDNWHLTFFSFFIPMRLVWTNAPKFFGEQDNPTDTIAYTLPTCTSPANGYAVGSLQDYLDLPTVGQVAGGNTVTHNNLIPRCYNLVYNEWMRDENLQTWVGPNRPAAFNDGPDTANNFTLRARGKRFDYITQALPNPQKGNTAISLPLGSTAPVVGIAGTPIGFFTSAGTFRNINLTNAATTVALATNSDATGLMRLSTNAAQTGMQVDLSGATGTTLNAFRTAVAMQQYLEKDARGGTRYNEFVYNHYGVRTQDSRLNRPEMIGGGYAPIITTAIPQTSATGLTGGTTPAGSLAASGHANGNAGFTYSATEHGYILTLVCATTDQTYQQGMRRHYSASTRYDIPVPLLANLGEQAMLQKEIFVDGSANDNNVFGYVPRWDEYRFIPSGVRGIFRSTAAGTIDYWHSSQKLLAAPTLNSTYITDDSHTTVQRNFAAGASSEGQQVLADFYFDIKCARALPLYGIPGLTRL